MMVLRYVIAALSAAALAACANVKPFDYAAPHEVKPGPGIFSGQDGEFVLLGKPKT
ncbi:hypothetical protein ABIE65_005371 [Constrictibacter sp. MBR-5]|jgi:hypothetical protein|uniref:hypothetical protein n=1 Tax=Constrictibacter sp. MBR-5 TaxID=3156467 RepID=UPI0033941C88